MTTSLVIADRFLDSVALLPSADKGRVFDFMLRFRDNPAHPAISLERIDAARSAGVWSGRITVGLRAILFKDGEHWVAVHAGRHDAAYRWTEHHDIGRHETTGELQIVEIPVSRPAPPPAPVAPRPVAPAPPAPLFADRQDSYLSSLGVPATWLPVVREIRSEDELLQIASKLPQEVADRLVRLAMGELVTPPVPLPPAAPIPAGAQSSLLVEPDLVTLEAALEAPLERWIGFLHPTQRQLVQADPRGPTKVTGSAGTGKTTVALHRARHLARAGLRVLLTTYVTTLAHNLVRQLRVLCTPEELGRITVSTVHARALSVCKDVDALVQVATEAEVRQALEQARLGLAPQLDPRFVRAEYDAVVVPQGIGTWQDYRVARRTGRGKPLSVAERKVLWSVFERALTGLEARRRLDWTGLCRFGVRALEEGRVKSGFDAVLVDELQDLRPVELRFLRALARGAPERLALYGDAGQRLYAGGVTLSGLGIDVRGRSHVLRLNYRTTEQIRRAAEGVLGAAGTDDFDGGTSSRATRSLHTGPAPELRGFDTSEAERDGAIGHVRGWLEAGIEAAAIAVFARTNSRVVALVKAFEGAGVAVSLLSDDAHGPNGEAASEGGIRVGTMHRAKGLEFKAVLVHDASAATLPSPGALAACEDPQDRDEVLERERHLLYVAMTRARDRLTITWTGAPSPFLAVPLAARG